MRLTRLAQLVLAAAMLGTLLLPGCQRQDQQQALELLARARTAEQTASLEGEVQTDLARPEGTVRAQAEIARTPEKTVIRFTEGPAKGREIVQQRGQGYEQRGGEDGAPRRLPGVVERIPSPEELTKRYEVKLGEETQIAGRPVQQVEIRPREGRSEQSVSLWLDVQTGFPLGHERRDPFGRVVHSTRYLRVKYGPPTSVGGAAESVAGEGTAPGPVASASPAAPVTPGGAARGERPGAGSSGAPAETHPDRARGPRGTGPSTDAPPWSSGRPGGMPRGPRPPGSPEATPGPRPGAPTGERYRPEIVTLEKLSEILGFAVTPPAFVPEGFTLRHAMVTRPVAGRENARRGILHYSDGVAGMTVVVSHYSPTHFRAPAGAADPGGAAVVKRGRGSFAIAIRGPALYLVSGPVPDETLQRVAASVP